MSIGKRQKNGNKYYKFKDIPKIHKLTGFFKHGFYITLVIWIFEFIFVSFYNGAEIIKIIVTAVYLSVYSFFAIGKVIVERKFGKLERY